MKLELITSKKTAHKLLALLEDEHWDIEEKTFYLRLKKAVEHDVRD